MTKWVKGRSEKRPHANSGHGREKRLETAKPQIINELFQRVRWTGKPKGANE